MLRPFLAALVCVVALCEAIWAWPRLPDTVASHFDATGSPDAWSSKTSFFAILGGVWALMVALFFVLPLWIPRIPTALVNMPYKEHWLAPERRDASLAWMADWMREIGLGTLALMAGVTHLTIQANLGEGETLTGFGWWMLVYALALLFWLVRMFVRFRRPTS